MSGRKGGLSVFRIGLISGVVGIVLVSAGVFAFYSDQQSRRVPFEIPPYPGAEAWGTGEGNSYSRDLFFKVPEVPAETVAAYYQERMVAHYNSTQENCVRNPPEGEFPTGDVENAIPYQYRCMFDNSGIGTSQYTLVTLYPGQPNEDPFLDAAGATVIQYEQVWQQ